MREGGKREGGREERREGVREGGMREGGMREGGKEGWRGASLYTTCFRLRCSIRPLQTSTRETGLSELAVLAGFRKASMNIRGRARLSIDEDC